MILVIGGAAGWLLVAFLYGDRGLARRMRRLAASTSAIAEGALETTIDASGHDEITDIAQALVVFRDHARDHERLRSEQQERDLHQRHEQQRILSSLADDLEAKVRSELKGVVWAART
ncbi:MAG: methyl-accepting chemotaxis protein [Rhodospirillaceae bacterium]|nr:MAG: methyl-accepting chemotaxis protein [Rhodospirillaceae bacterium]